jgi:Lipocalin-like domain
MRTKVAVILVGLVALVAGGCKDSTGPSAQSLIGTWHATKAEYVSIANPTTKVDIIATGSTLTLVLSSSNFVLTITDPGANPVVSNGTWSSSIDEMTLVPTTGWFGESQFDMSLSGNQLTLTGGHLPHAFTPGNPEDAILNLILVRQ